MDFVVDKGLVVDSSFGSRQLLLRQLRESGSITTVVDAPSIDEALVMLRSENLDACVMGPALSPQSAVDFVRTAKSYEKAKHCAFIAVLKPEAQNVASELVQLGTHGILDLPYSPGKFNSIVKNALRRAKKPTIYNNEEDGWQRAIHITRILSNEAKQSEIAKLINTGTAKLRDVAALTSQKKLSFSADGTPSEALREALRNALRAFFPEQESIHNSETFDYHFVESAIQWFCNRIHLPQASATERLRQELLAFHQQHQSKE